MSGLINVDILLNKAWDADNGFGWEKVVSIKDVMDAPTIDAVPVVRCKDCKWYKTMYCKMDRWTDLVTVYVAKKDDYCSYGEWRENDAKKTNRVGDDRKI